MCSPVLASRQSSLYMLQEAAAGVDDESSWQLQLQCLLAIAALQLPPPPPTSAAQPDAEHAENASVTPADAGPSAAEANIPKSNSVASSPKAAQNPQPEQAKLSSTMPPVGKATYNAVTTLHNALAGHFPSWLKKLQAGSQQPDELRSQLATVQWQLAGVVQQLHSSLTSRAAQSPTNQSLSLNLKVPALQLTHMASFLLAYVFVHSVKLDLRFVLAAQNGFSEFCCTLYHDKHCKTASQLLVASSIGGQSGSTNSGDKGDCSQWGLYQKQPAHCCAGKSTADLPAQQPASADLVAAARPASVSRCSTHDGATRLVCKHTSRDRQSRPFQRHFPPQLPAIYQTVALFR